MTLLFNESPPVEIQLLVTVLTFYALLQLPFGMCSYQMIDRANSFLIDTLNIHLER